MGHQAHPTTVPKNAESNNDAPNVVYELRNVRDSYHPVTVGRFTDETVAETVKEELPDKVNRPMDLRINERILCDSPEQYYEHSPNVSIDQ